MKKKVGKMVCTILMLGLLSTNAFAMQVDNVLASTHDVYTIVFNIHVKHSESYKDITFRNGYNVSTTTNTYTTSVLETIDVTYSYSTY